jgi:hypothetical protein
VVGPEEVDLAAHHVMVDQWTGELRLLERRQQRVLELAARRLGMIVGAAGDQAADQGFRAARSRRSAGSWLSVCAGVVVGKR